ncbi:MAG: hypothetical protein ACLQU1_15185 [Bryobacteraceae bacterium]
MLDTVFDRWVHEAGQKLRVSGEYPLIDSPEIDMADELRTLANKVVEERPGEAPTAIPSDIEPTIEFLELRLITSRASLQVRFVVLNFLYRLAHFTGFVSENAAQELRGVVWPHLKRFVGLHIQEVKALQDPRVIRWEITNACAVHDWGVASELFDLLKSSRANTELQYRALKGKMYVCSVAAPRHAHEVKEDLGGAPYEDLGWLGPEIRQCLLRR